MVFAYGLISILFYFTHGVNAVIHSCDANIIHAFQSGDPLKPNVLEYYVNGKDFWRVSSTTNEQVGYAFTISYAPIINNTSNVTIALFDDNGAVTATSTTPYTEGLEGRVNKYFFSSTFQASFAFKCSKRLSAAYRCQIDGNNGVGPMYAIHASQEYLLSDVQDEREECKNKILEIDPLAPEFVDENYPAWSR